VRRASEPHLRCRLTHADVEYVASSHYQASVVCSWVAAAILSRSVEDDVHVAVAVDHLAPILSIVLQLYSHVSVHLADAKVQRLSRGFEVAALSRPFGGGPKDTLANPGAGILATTSSWLSESI